MANFTKNAIKSSFLKPLNERPLSQITVKDIVSDCGVNRNTSYYHFKDIPKLIEDIIVGDTEPYHTGIPFRGFDRKLSEHHDRFCPEA